MNRRYPYEPPASLQDLLPGDEDFYRYHVLRNGVRIPNVRQAHVSTGEVEVYRYRQTKNLITGAMEETQIAVGLDRPESERFLSLPREENGVKVKVEIIRHLPPAGSASWDNEPTAKDKMQAAVASAEQGMGVLFEAPQRPAIRMPPSAPRQMPVASLALDFGE